MARPAMARPFLFEWSTGPCYAVCSSPDHQVPAHAVDALRVSEGRHFKGKLVLKVR